MDERIGEGVLHEVEQNGCIIGDTYTCYWTMCTARLDIACSSSATSGIIACLPDAIA